MTGQVRCVIADDVRLIREQLGEWMRELGFSVTYANCGATALQAVRQSIPEIIVTDIDMPQLSGLHLLQMIRSDPNLALARTPVIVSSSLEDVEIRRMIHQLDGTAFLKKPVSKKRFFQCIEELLTGSPVMSDSAASNPHAVSPRFRRIALGLRDG